MKIILFNGAVVVEEFFFIFISSRGFNGIMSRMLMRGQLVIFPVRTNESVNL